MSAIRADVVVIGAGPIGLFTVFALGQVGLSTVVVDCLAEAGGQCGALYPEKPIYDIPTRAVVTGGDLVRDLLKQVEPYGATFLFGCRAETLAGKLGQFTIGLSDGKMIETGAVVVAAGAGAFKPNRPPVEGIEEHEGTSVFYDVRSPERFRDKDIVICGGGDSAADWAVALASVARSVALVHRRPAFRAAPATMAAIDRLSSEQRIRIVAPATLHGLRTDGPRLTGIFMDDGTGSRTALPADALLCFFGLAKDLSVLASWGIGADRSGIPVDYRSMETVREGVFAIGDIASYAGKLKLILTGFAEATAAAHAARHRLQPNQAFHFEYSTTKGRPSALEKADANG